MILSVSKADDEPTELTWEPDWLRVCLLEVAPAELEAVLLSHPQIADAGVVGIPDPGAGELPMAWVVPKANASISEIDVQDFVAG